MKDILQMEANGKDQAWSVEPNKAQKRVGDGYRQYIGFTRGKRRFIYINSFSDWTPDAQGRWKREAVVICDGGSDYWGLEYDVEAKTFANFATNGRV